MKKTLAILTLVGMLPLWGCGDDDAERDMTYPVISGDGFRAEPLDCERYYLGDTIRFHYVFTDDTELGNYTISIHNNFDHHTHGTSTSACDDDDDAIADHDHEHDHDALLDPSAQWIFEGTYTIPAGQQRYEARQDIVIPRDAAVGDYHFMVRLTDQAGWQQLKAVGIKLID